MSATIMSTKAGDFVTVTDGIRVVATSGRLPRGGGAAWIAGSVIVAGRWFAPA